MKTATLVLLLATTTTLRSETIWIQQEKRICDQIFTATRVLEFDGTDYTYLGGNIDKDIDCLFTASKEYETTEEIKPAEFPNPAVIKTHSILQTSSWTSNDDYIVDVTDVDVELRGPGWFLYFRSQEPVSGEIGTVFTREDGTEFVVDAQSQTHSIGHASRWLLEDGTGEILRKPQHDLWSDVLFRSPSATIPDNIPSGAWGIPGNLVRVPFAVVGPLLDVLPDPDRIIRYNVPEPNSLLPLLFCLFLKRFRQFHSPRSAG